MRQAAVDYPRLDYYRRRHRERFAALVEKEGLLCQECGGAGEYHEIISSELGGPWYDCGWCEGTGKVTRWLRGQWLRWKRQSNWKK